MNAQLTEVADLLRELVSEVRGLRSDLAREERPSERKPLSRQDRTLLTRLLPAIAGAIGSEPFFVYELFESESAALRVALRGLNAKKVGRLLRRAVGTPIDGLVVEAVDREAGAWLWRVSEFLGNENLSVAPAAGGAMER